ncbi:hypothetical protein, partial [Stenotrophomonas sp. HMWF023]|uniref:hypothetical protein n=1 Tax=Stenotrophomonas sp. HMWF023 TaxID=2056859 RepID=UPI0015E84A8B
FFARPTWLVAPTFNPASHTFRWAYTLPRSTAADITLLRLGGSRAIGFHAFAPKQDLQLTLQHLSELADGVEFAIGHRYLDATSRTPVAQVPIMQWIAGDPLLAMQQRAAQEGQRIQRASDNGNLGGRQAIAASLLLLAIIALTAIARQGQGQGATRGKAGAAKTDQARAVRHK